MIIVLKLSFKDAIEGGNKSVRYEKMEPCKACKGTGGKSGTGRVKCPHCNGSGMKTTTQRNIVFSTPCPNCEGTGSILKEPCKYFNG